MDLKTAEFLGDCWGNLLLHYLPSLVNVWHVLLGSQDCEVSTGENDEKGIGGGRKKDPLLFNMLVTLISLMTLPRLREGLPRFREGQSLAQGHTAGQFAPSHSSLLVCIW